MDIFEAISAIRLPSKYLPFRLHHHTLRHSLSTNRRLYRSRSSHKNRNHGMTCDIGPKNDAARARSLDRNRISYEIHVFDENHVFDTSHSYHRNRSHWRSHNLATARGNHTCEATPRRVYLDLFVQCNNSLSGGPGFLEEEQ